MIASDDPPRIGLAEIGRFLEVQNLGLNLPFVLAFLLFASGGNPGVRTTVLVVVAFVAARTAGHSFNRWADRDLDARNPRTRGRALVTGRLSTTFALGVAGLSAAVLVVAAYLLNPLALLLVPVALLLVLGYSYTKRFSALTTVCLGAVEALTPGAVYVAVQGAIPGTAVIAAVAMGSWGTAFETIHSIGDLEADREAGTHSLPLTLGIRDSVRLVPALHLVAGALFLAYGARAGLPAAYYAAALAMMAGAAVVDLALHRDPTRTRPLFQAHFVLSGIFLLGAILCFVPR